VFASANLGTQGLLSVSEFEYNPDWVPNLDAMPTLDCMPACTKELTRFELRGIYAARVLNASMMGQQKSPFRVFR
jgi:hypothetical protein